VPPALGRRRAPPGDITIPCEELADGGPSRSARGLEGAVDPKGAASSGPEAEQDEKPKARSRRRRRMPQIARMAKVIRWRAERRPHVTGNGACPVKAALHRRAIPSTFEGDEKSLRRARRRKKSGQRSVG